MPTASFTAPTFGRKGLGRHGFWRALSGGTPPAPPSTSVFLLLEDGTSYLLLEDGVSKLILEASN